MSTTTEDRLRYMETGYDSLMDQLLILPEDFRASIYGRNIERQLRRLGSAIQVAERAQQTERPLINPGTAAVLSGRTPDPITASLMMSNGQNPFPE